MVRVSSGGKAYLLNVRLDHDFLAIKVSRHIRERQSKRDIPREESHEKAGPGEEECATIFVDGVQHGNRSRLSVQRVDFRSHPEMGDLERHREL